LSKGWSGEPIFPQSKLKIDLQLKKADQPHLHNSQRLIDQQRGNPSAKSIIPFPPDR